MPHIPHIPYHVGNDPSVTCARWARVPSIIWNWNSPLASRLCHNLCVVAVGAPLSVIQLVRHRAIDIDSQQAGSPFLNLHGESGREETSQLSKSIRNAGRCALRALSRLVEPYGTGLGRVRSPEEGFSTRVHAAVFSPVRVGCVGGGGVSHNLYFLSPWW